MIVNSKEDKIYCCCGEKMKPFVYSNIVQYRCPKCRIWNFWKHSLPEVFERMYESKRGKK